MAKKRTSDRPNGPEGPSYDGPEWPPHALWPLDRIKPYPKNARTHPPEQISLLAQHLRRWGPDQPIVVDEDGVILKGHGRLAAALEAGLDSFPVVQRVGLPDVEKAAVRLADNQVGLLSGWDTQLIRAEVAELAAEDLPLLGFSDAQLERFTAPIIAPGEFAAFGEDIETQHCCPKCGYRWSGRADAGAQKEGDA